MKPIQSHIILEELELYVHLGWPEIERASKQRVTIDIHLSFITPPEACRSDQLDDTVDYERLSNAIIEKIGTKTYRLIEHLGHEVYCLAKQMMSDAMLINIHVKKTPPIVALKGGVSFYIGDF